MKIQSFKWLLPAAFLALCGLQTKAQQIDLGVRGGLSIPNLSAGGSDNIFSKGYKSRTGPEFGIFGEYHFSKLFSVEAMVNYSGQGGKKEGMQAMNIPPKYLSLIELPPGVAPILYANIKSEAKFNYLMIPVLAKFGWNLGKSPFRLYVSGGPFVGFLLNAKQVVSGTSAMFMDEEGKSPLIPSSDLSNTVDIKDQIKKVNFGVSANVGVAYGFGRHNIFVEGGGNYGFLKIQKDAQYGENRIGAGTVTLGYAYRIKK